MPRMILSAALVGSLAVAAVAQEAGPGDSLPCAADGPARPPDDDGAAQDRDAPAGGQRKEPQGAERRQLRRVEGQAVSNLPDPLVLNDGEKVTTPELWWAERRPEIVEDFDREVYGRVPEDVPG